MKPYNSSRNSKKEEVAEMFDNIAPTYDRLNHIFSLSIDKLWRRRVVRIVRRMKPSRILDLATGTGDLAIKMAARMRKARVMDVADGVIDVVTVAFGVRNFGDLEAGLAEIRRSLRSGGHAVILEFSMPRNPLVRRLYGLYSNHVLGPVGGLVSHDREAYDYLPASIAEFPEPERFLDIMREAGFVDCRRRSQSLGIAQIYIGRKP